MSDTENDGGCSLTILFLVGGVWGLLQTLGIVDCSVIESDLEASVDTHTEEGGQVSDAAPSPNSEAHLAKAEIKQSVTERSSQGMGQGPELRSLKEALRTQASGGASLPISEDWKWLGESPLVQCANSHTDPLSRIPGLEGMCLERSRVRMLSAVAKPFQGAKQDADMSALNPQAVDALGLNAEDLKRAQEAAKAQDYWIHLETCQYKPLERGSLEVTCDLPNLYLNAPPQRFVAQSCLEANTPCEQVVTLRQEPLSLVIQPQLNLEQLATMRVFLHFKLLEAFPLPALSDSPAEVYFKVQPQWVGWVTGQGDVAYGLQEGLWSSTFAADEKTPLTVTCDDALCTACVTHACEPR